MPRNTSNADKFDRLVEDMKASAKEKHENNADYFTSTPHKYEFTYLYDDRATVRLVDAYENTCKRIDGMLANPSGYGLDSDYHEELKTTIGQIRGDKEDGYTRRALESFVAPAGSAGGLGDYREGYMRMGVERTLPVILDSLAMEHDNYIDMLDTLAELDIITNKQAKAAKKQYESPNGWHFLEAPEGQRPFDIGFTGAAYIVGKYKDKISEELFSQAFGCDFDGYAVQGVASSDGMRYALESVEGVAKAYDDIADMRGAATEIIKRQKARDNSRKSFASLKSLADAADRDTGEELDDELEGG